MRASLSTTNNIILHNTKGNISQNHISMDEEVRYDDLMNKPEKYRHEASTNYKKKRIVLDSPFSSRSTISYGLIVFAKNTRRWAVIQRKHSIEFLLYIRGLYRITHLPLLLSHITQKESLIIRNCLSDIPLVFTDIYINELELPREGLEYALIRIEESHDVTLNVLNKLDISGNDLKWTWPKGRMHISSNKETPFDCAKREFKEEVEISLPPPLYMSDTYVSENIRTIAGRNIEARYWIYIISEEIPMTTPHGHPEVADRKWTSTDSCKLLMGDNNLFSQIVDIVSRIV